MRAILLLQQCISSKIFVKVYWFLSKQSLIGPHFYGALFFVYIIVYIQCINEFYEK